MCKLSQKIIRAIALIFWFIRAIAMFFRLLGQKQNNYQGNCPNLFQCLLDMLWNREMKGSRDLNLKWINIYVSNEWLSLRLGKGARICALLISPTVINNKLIHISWEASVLVGLCFNLKLRLTAAMSNHKAVFIFLLDNASVDHVRYQVSSLSIGLSLFLSSSSLFFSCCKLHLYHI